MRRKSRSRAEAVETAWRVHAAQSDWTAKVDAKAVFAFTFETAALAIGVSLSHAIQAAAEASWLRVVPFWFGIICLSVAAGFSALVVLPRLRSKRLKVEADHNFIYFGHARFWSPKAMRSQLLSEDELDQLTRQITVMAKVAWIKHVQVQWSFVLGVLGSTALAVFAVLLWLPF